MQDEARTADWSDKVLPSSDPYMFQLSEFRYQGVGPSLEALVVGAGRSYHLAENALFRRDGQHALQAIVEIRDLLYKAIQHAHQGDRLHFGHYDVHSAAAAPNTSVPSTSVPSTSAPATSGPWTSVTPPHATTYISPNSLHVYPTQHTGIPYVANPDWTLPRYMHDIFLLTSPTFRMRPILRPLPKSEGEAEVMVVADVTTEVGVWAEAEAEVQLQIVIQLHQMREEDQGQHRQEREGHNHRLHMLARDIKLSILKSDAKKTGTAPDAEAIKSIKEDPALLSDPKLSNCSDFEITDLSKD
ncbi:hypothetical protein CsSME_00009293 [Camellia sinensis var. sinensis]